MTSLIAEPLVAEAFAPFGDLISGKTQPGRLFFSEGLRNLRPDAGLALYTTFVPPAETAGFAAVMMERHLYSSQTFLPLVVGRYLVLVAPDAPDGGPDMARARAFIGQAGQGITYRPTVWHHGMTVFDRPANFAVTMWRDGTSGDEEFRDLPAPVAITVPAA